MVERQIGNSYPVDGESFAHGKATDMEVVFDHDDIVEQLVEALMEDTGASSIKLGDADENIAQFLGDYYTETIEKRCDYILLDDDYFTEKHRDCIEDCIIDLGAGDDFEMVYEYTKMV